VTVPPSTSPFRFNLRCPWAGLLLGVAVASRAAPSPATEGEGRLVPNPPAARDVSPPPDRSGAPARPDRWEVRTQDITLARTLERWAADAGVHIKWDAQRNFLIGASDVYVGSFESALQAVLGSSGIRQSDFPLEACIYPNHPPLVRITRQGEQAQECPAS